jgi:hypothetical protein
MLANDARKGGRRRLRGEMRFYFGQNNHSARFGPRKMLKILRVNDERNFGGACTRKRPEPRDKRVRLLIWPGHNALNQAAWDGT